MAAVTSRSARALPPLSLSLLLLLLGIGALPTAADAFALGRVWDGVEAAQVLLRSGVLAVWGTTAVRTKANAATQFFRGLDDIHVCLTGGGAGAELEHVLPPLTLGERVRSWTIPFYRSSLALARAELLEQRRRSAGSSNAWAGCITGSVRSVAAGYVYVNDIVSLDLLGRIADPLFQRVPIELQHAGDGARRIGSRIARLIDAAGRKRMRKTTTKFLGWE